MIVQPKIRGFICTTAHPEGCAGHIQKQIDFIESAGTLKKGPKNVLIIGSSTGYGLSSRVMAAFGAGSKTIGVFYERPAEGKRTATAGWYNTVAFEQKAHDRGLYARSFNGDAFSDEMKRQVVDAIREDLGSVDLIIYSLASPRRVHPKTGQLAKSALKPVGKSYTNKSIDMSTLQLETVTLPAATDDEIEQTVSVMGGEDWRFWIEALLQGGVLAEGAMTVAYSYIGPELTRGVYRNGTIGRAKDHLEATARELDALLSEKLSGHAYISVNKALVTQSSSAIPFIPLYFVLLKKVMTAAGLEEDCIAQIYRLFTQVLYSDAPNPELIDEQGYIRMDSLEMRPEIQRDVEKAWAELNEENLAQLADLEGYQADFLQLFGFGLQGVDYDADVVIDLPLPSASCSTSES